MDNDVKAVGERNSKSIARNRHIFQNLLRKTVMPVMTMSFTGQQYMRMMVPDVFILECFWN
jgi:hypothetical protein